ncbi:hypothetical protein AB6A40_001924 [Gnathostoma spinigerum]|uniref:Glycine-rich protein n=1 Tax=Gnathostoma spinigerum TaxID=75299 RepID=A0ABD6E5C4_9BILA
MSFRELEFAESEFPKRNDRFRRAKGDLMNSSMNYTVGHIAMKYIIIPALLLLLIVSTNAFPNPNDFRLRRVKRQWGYGGWGYPYYGYGYGYGYPYYGGGGWGLGGGGLLLNGIQDVIDAAAWLI